MQKQKALILTLILIISIGLLGCGSDTQEKAEKNKAQSQDGKLDLSDVVLRIGAADAKNGQAVLIGAGLDDTPYKVEFHVMQGGNLVMEALAADQLDLGTGSQIPPIFSSQAKNGGNFRIIATKKATTLHQDLVVPADSPIKEVAQLKRKKVAYVKSTTAHYFLAKMLENAGVEWNEVDTIAMSTSDGLTALLTGEIDALASYGHAIRTAHQKGATTLQSAKDILSGDFYWYATPAAISDPKKHAAILDYLARFHAGNEWTRKNSEAWASFYAPQINQKTDVFLDMFNEENAQAEVVIVPVDQSTIASEQDIIDTFAKLGLLEASFDANKIFDRSFDAEIAGFPKY